MEVFNFIWNAISTPNEFLINILLIPLAFFAEMPLTFSLIANVFKINYTKLQRHIYIVLTTFMSVLTIYFIPWPFNVILNYIVAFAILYFILKLHIFKALIASLFPSIIFSLIGYLLLNPYLTLLNITYEQANTIPIFRIPFVFLMYLTILLFNIIFKYRKVSITILENFDKKTKFIIILNFLFGLFYVVIQGVLTVNYIDILPIQFTFFNFICLFIYFSLSFYTLAKITNLVTTTQKLESAEEYNKTLHILHDSVRGFKHDFDNIVTTIGGYIQTDDIDGLKNYYAQLQDDCQKVNNLYILNPDIINNPGIYNLIASKYQEAENKQIKVNLTFLLDLENLNMKIYEFARILGILLDNAIDAASECNEKILNIIFRNDSRNNVNLIIVENTYKNKNVDLNGIFDKGFTEKENHTGLGLWEVRQILKKNNNLNLHTTKNNDFFIQQFEIYY